MSGQMYRVGDYAYFETSPNAPYSIRRIEELIKSPNGAVEAKVMIYYRRRELASNLIPIADKHQSALEEENESGSESLTEKQRHQLKHKELFLARQVETLPATYIRGKCSVTLLSEIESLSSYLTKEDSFYYSLVFDQNQKTLLADRGEIRVGSRSYQAEVPDGPLEDPPAQDDRDLSQMETLIFSPEHGLTDKEFDQYLIVARSIGTFARALDYTSSIKQPSLHMSAASASRDVTLINAVQALHNADYDIGKAVLSLVPSSGPVLCRDELEEWSSSEANLFEEALEKYGKEFSDVRHDYLPWKTQKNIVEYYYMWKTTDRYVQQKRVKAVEAENKLKQVYIPNYNVKNGGGMQNGGSLLSDGRPCESCTKTHSSQWFSWGPVHMGCRLCNSCWQYWKKNGGLKYPTKIDLEKLPVGSPTNPKDQALPNNGSNNLVCRECNKAFSRPDKYQAHMQAHKAQRSISGGLTQPKDLKIQNNGTNNGSSKVSIPRQSTNNSQAMPLSLTGSGRSGSPKPIMKTRAAFFMLANQLTRLSRRLCYNEIRIRRAAKNPTVLINSSTVRTELIKLTATGIPSLKGLLPINRGTLKPVSERKGIPASLAPEWLVATPRDQLPQPEKLAFDPPPKGPDGKFILPRTGIMYLPDEQREEVKPNVIAPPMSTPSKKRAHDQNGVDAIPTKRRQLAPPGMLRSPSDAARGVAPGMLSPGGTAITGGAVMNGRTKMNNIAKYGGRNKMFSWVDAPDDVYFIATDSTKKMRRSLGMNDLRRAARRPWRDLLKLRSIPSLNDVILPPLANQSNNNSSNNLLAPSMQPHIPPLPPSEPLPLHL